jgi:hypothetical protein
VISIKSSDAFTFSTEHYFGLVLCAGFFLVTAKLLAREKSLPLTYEKEKDELYLPYGHNDASVTIDNCFQETDTRTHTSLA